VELVLSIFPGIDLLGKAFSKNGFCVVTGPDIITGGDIRKFVTVPGRFNGIIGGSPCQDFSKLRRVPPTGYGLEMLAEFKRVIDESQPDWWLLENVAGVPDLKIDGYSWQRTDINLGWFGDCSRLRHIQFGSKNHDFIDLPRGVCDPTVAEGAATCSDDRPFSKLVEIQGLPVGFDLPSFNLAGKKRAVGNGVPLPMGEALARAVIGRGKSGKRCACDCGRTVIGRQLYSDQACRKRAQRKRDYEEANSVTVQANSVTGLANNCDSPAHEFFGEVSI
jgi:DNA (cytosine-5)-methyltransferase 1